MTRPLFFCHRDRMFKSEWEAHNRSVWVCEYPLGKVRCAYAVIWPIFLALIAGGLALGILMGMVTFQPETIAWVRASACLILLTAVALAPAVWTRLGYYLMRGVDLDPDAGDKRVSWADEPPTPFWLEVPDPIL